MVGVSTGFALSSSPGQCGDAAIVTGAFSYHLEAMQQKWKPGDLVVVVTVNRGLPVQQERKGRKPRDVRRLSPKKRTRSGVYAVPDGEIRSRKR
jgi:hypothetical protein